MTVLTPWLLDLLLFFSHWLWVRRLPYPTDQKILAVLIILSAQKVVSQILLGFFSLLTADALLILNLSIGIFLIITCVLRYGFRSMCQELPGIRSISLGSWLFTLLIGAVYGYIVFLNTLVPPFDWDSLTYHLTDVFSFASNQSVSSFQFPWIQPYFPKVGELLVSWLYLLGGGDKAAFLLLNTVQLPYALMGGVAVYSAAKILGLQKGAFLAIPLYVLTPLIMIQTLTCMVDVIAAAFFLTALVFLLSYRITNRFLDLHFAAIGFGLLIGTKFTFLYLSWPLIIFFLLGTDRSKIPLVGELYRLMPKMVTLLLCVALGSGFWLTRNSMSTGNPIYPIQLRIAGITFFDGPIDLKFSEPHEQRFVDSKWGWFIYPFKETYGGGPWYSNWNGFGPQFLVGLISTLFALVYAGRRKEYERFWVFMILPLSIVLWLYFNPYREPRYISAICGIAILGFLYTLKHLTPITSRILKGVAMAAMAFSLVASAWLLVPHETLVLKTYLERGELPLETFYRAEFGSLGEAFVWMGENIRNSTIAFTFSELPALLYGWDHSNKLTFIPTTESSRFKNLTRAVTYKAWRRLLFEAKVDYIFYWLPDFVSKHPYPASVWIHSYPDDFEVVKSWTPGIILYKPIYTDTEIAAFLSEQSEPRVSDKALSFADLNDPASWFIEYEKESKLKIEKSSDAVRYSWSFYTLENDYGEITAGFEQTDWSWAHVLEFDLFRADAADRLYVYLKGKDSREHERFLIHLGQLPQGWNRVTLDLYVPLSKTKKFSLAEVETIHLVVDDEPDSRLGSGSILFGNFRLRTIDGEPSDR